MSMQKERNVGDSEAIKKAITQAAVATMIAMTEGSKGIRRLTIGTRQASTGEMMTSGKEEPH